MHACGRVDTVADLTPIAQGIVTARLVYDGVTNPIDARSLLVGYSRRSKGVWSFGDTAKPFLGSLFFIPSCRSVSIEMRR